MFSVCRADIKTLHFNSPVSTIPKTNAACTVTADTGEKESSLWWPVDEFQGLAFFGFSMVTGGSLLLDASAYLGGLLDPPRLLQAESR